jgi:hypothetical protein
MQVSDSNLVGTSWRKSTHSGAQGDCIEVADDVPGAIPVRDSKHLTGPVLTFTPEAWRAFVAGIQAGGFHLHD